MQHVMKTFRRNKKAGLAAAMRKARKTFKKKKKK
jgi:hypothetical protein